jgi:hypothetical protein
MGGAQNKQTKAMAAGSLIDELLTTDGTRVRVIVRSHDAKGTVVDDPTDRRLKQTQEQFETIQAEGQIPCLRHEYESARNVANAIRDKAAARGFPIHTGEFQVAIRWIETADDGTEVPCKCKMDVFHPHGLVQDIKRLADCSREGVRRAVRQFGYDIQSAAYLSAVRATFAELEGRERFQLVCAEDEAPFPLSIVEMSGPMLELGNRKWRHAVNLWARLTNERPAGNWPDYSDAPMRIEPTTWELSEAEFN